MASKILFVLADGFKEAMSKGSERLYFPNRGWGGFISAMTRNRCRYIISQRQFSPVCLFHSCHLSWHLIVFHFNKERVIASVVKAVVGLLILAVCLEAITDRTIIPGKLISIVWIFIISSNQHCWWHTLWCHNQCQTRHPFRFYSLSWPSYHWIWR